MLARLWPSWWPLFAFEELGGVGDPTAGAGTSPPGVPPCGLSSQPPGEEGVGVQRLLVASLSGLSLCGTLVLSLLVSLAASQNCFH